jgi:hypothetical protein
LTHGNGWDGCVHHFFAPLDDLPSAAFAVTDGAAGSVGSPALISHRWAVELEPVGVVDNPIQDGIAESRLTNNFVPSGHGELASDQRGAAAMAILDDLHKMRRWLAERRSGPQSSRTRRSTLTSIRNSRANRPSPWARSRSANRRGTRA